MEAVQDRHADMVASAWDAAHVGFCGESSAVDQNGTNGQGNCYQVWWVYHKVSRVVLPFMLSIMHISLGCTSQ